jgi:hypothetical protein
MCIGITIIKIDTSVGATSTPYGRTELSRFSVMPMHGGKSTCLSILPPMVAVPFAGIMTSCAAADFTAHNLPLARSNVFKLDAQAFER